MARGRFKMVQIEVDGGGNIATDLEVSKMISGFFVNPGHSGLSGLNNDDHPQYFLTDGSRKILGTFESIGDIWSGGDINCKGNMGCDGNFQSVGDISTDEDFYATNESGKGLVVKDKTTGILYRIIVDGGIIKCEKI